MALKSHWESQTRMRENRHHRYHHVACFPKVHCGKAILPKDIRKKVQFCLSALDTRLGVCNIWRCYCANTTIVITTPHVP